MSLHQKGNTSIKLLINEEVTSKETIKRGPGVVARLMGMDTLPPEKGQKIHGKESFDENPRKNISRVPRFVNAKFELNSPSSTTFSQSKEQSSPNYNKQQYSSPSTKSSSLAKSHRREHPQEELLQKFKKEFESWQASKSWECSTNLDQNDGSQGLKTEQNLNFNKEKMTSYSNCSRYRVQKKPIEADDLDKQDDMAIRKKLTANSFEPVSRSKFQEKSSRSSSPTRIVILKPSCDINEVEELRTGSSEAAEKGSSSMEHFLEEVKERLRLEMEGKGRIDSTRRGNSAHSSPHERSADPKQLARDIAKHVRESVAKDLGSTSARSESAKSFRNDFLVNEHDSQDSIKKDTRKLISDRLKNVLKDDAEFEKPMFEKERLKSMTDFSKKENGASFWEEKKAVNESIPRYLRREHTRLVEFDANAMSPLNLSRSFSAPASRTAFATGAEYDSEAINRDKKDGFNFKGRVSTLRRNLSLKRKIFGKKMPSLGEAPSETFSYTKSMETMPSVIRNFCMVEVKSMIKSI